MPHRDRNVLDKAGRLLDEGRVVELTSDLYGVEGDHGTYLIAIVPTAVVRPVRGTTGTVVPRQSCTCVAAKVDGVVCSHIVAARTLQHRIHPDPVDEHPADPFAGL